MRASLRILVVDDEPTDLALVVRLLRRDIPDAQVEQAANAADLSRLLDAGDFDLVVTDYYMGWSDGLKVLRESKARWPEVPVIMFTGTGSEEVAVEAMRAGVDDYVLKSPQGLVRLPKAALAALERVSERRLFREREAAYRGMFDGLPVGVYRSTPEGRVLMANPALVRMLGYSSFEELAARDLEKEGFRGDYSRAEFKRRAEREGHVTGWETSWDRRDGSTVFVRESARVIRDQAGNILFYEGVVEDITERKHADEALKASEKRFQDIADNAQVWIWETDAEGKYTYSNQIVEKILGYTPQEMLQKYFHDLFHPEDAETLKSAAEAALAAKEAFREFVNRNVHKNGQTVWLATSALPLLDDKGKLIGYRGSDTDITERKHAEQALAEERDRVQKYLDVAGVIFRVVDAKGDVTLINRKGCEVLGYEEHEVLGKNWFRHFVPRRARREVMGNFAKLMAGDEEGAEYTESALLTKTGEERAVAWHNTVLRDETGRIVATLSSGEDITERKQAEQALKASEERFKAMFELAPDAYYMSDLKGNILDGNRAAERIMGYAREELIGQNFLKLNLLSPNQIPKAASLLLRNVIGQPTGPDEFTLTRKDGSKFVAEITTYPVQIHGESLVLALARDVTGRRDTERQIAERRLYLEAVLASAPDAIISLDADHHIAEWNVGAARLFGYSKDEVVGKNIDDLIANSHAIREATALTKQVMSGQTLGPMETVRYRKDGTPVDVIISGSPVLVEGRFIGAVAVYTDITEHKHAEAALRESEERYRNLFDNIPIGLYRTAPDGRILTANRALLDMLGYASLSEFQKVSAPDVYADAADRPRQQAMLERAGVVRGFEQQMRRSDGDTIWALDNVRALKGDDGQTLYYEGSLEDITARKQAERNISRLAAVIEQAAESVIITDLDGNMEYVNPFFEKATGYTPAEALGQNPRILKSGRQSEEFYRTLWDTITSGRNWSGIMVNNRKDGSLFHEEASIFPVKDPSGQIINFAAVKRDITERVQAEAELRQAKEAAEAASRAKSEFLANISHEIRTPMNGIIGMTELALDTPLTDEQREYLSLSKSSAESLLRIINDILDFSKIEAGKMGLESIPFSLRDCLGDTMKALAVRAHNKGLELAYDVPAHVPDALIGDPGRLRQTIANLVGNAIKFTQHGEVVLFVEAEAETEEEAALQFAVADTGIGIPPDKQKTIFEAFTQADSSTTREYGGTGLGLTISSRLVEMMGGKMWVQSEVDIGSTFYFTARFRLQKDLETIPLAGLDELRGLYVLVVDDNETNRRILQDMLTSWRAKPVAAPSGRLALEIMSRAQEAGTPFALVITDMRMPEMDGFTLAGRIKTTPGLADAHVIVLSSSGLPGDAARCRELGIEAYLMKPVKQSEMLDTILTIFGPRLEENAALITRHSLRESRSRARVLLVEDNPVNQRLATRLLEKRGHVVTVANNGREALVVLEHASFDVVLMDIEMPEMDGFAATAAIREREKQTGDHIPIVAMTAHAMKGDRERCLAAGMDNYLPKPIQAKELLELVESLVMPPKEEPKPVKQQPSAPSADSVLDLGATLARVGGDEELLREISAMYLEESQQLMEQVREAIAAGDAQTLERAGHTLKGLARNFNAAPASGAALVLEEIGNEGRLGDAAEAAARLQVELDRLGQALRDFLEKPQE